VQYEFSVIGLAVLALAWFSAVAVFEFERRAQPNEFGKFSDAAWFVLTTLTTVGYGDRVPITLGGRLVTACTMIGGLGLFGTFVSLIGGAFVEELRHHRHRQRTADQQADAFDPQAVLDAIPGGMSQPEAIRLLEIACRRLVVEESESIAESSSL
jgi:voltage-gated potassium channel